jgi:pimeloyl-ACP methyl ester carboxylesterase
MVEDQKAVSQLDQAYAELLEIAVVRSKEFLEELRAFPMPLEEESGDPAFLDSIRQQPEKYAFSIDVDALSEPFAEPTLIICGRQDAVVGYQDAWRILPNFPRATIVVFDRAGHMLEEKDYLISALVNEWLDRVVESRG